MDFFDHRASRFCMVIGPGSVYVSTDFVALTEHQKNKRKDSIYRASGRMFAFKYEKVKAK